MASAFPVTVVIITRDRALELGQTLQRLAALPERPPVIVVANASGSSPPVSAPGVRLSRLPRNAGAAGRNVGVAQAHTPYVAFCDDDSPCAPDALPRRARVF